MPARESPAQAPARACWSPAGDHRRGRAAARDQRRRVRQLRHALRAGLGRTALARGTAGVRRADRPHAPPAGRGARPGALPARSPHGRAGRGRPRLPRAGGVRLGGLRAGRPVVRPGRRGAGGADPAHARADPLLRRARLRRRPLPAARPERPARRVTGADERTPRARGRGSRGAPVLALLALAGLLRPEAWASPASTGCI